MRATGAVRRVTTLADVSMSDPPVDPRTEGSSGGDASRPRPRSVIRPSHPADDSLGMPTVRVPLGRASQPDPAWSAAPPPAAAPAPYYPADGMDEPTQFVPPVGYEPVGGYAPVPPIEGFPPGYAVPFAPGAAPRRPRVRKVSRVLRSIDAWSVFKVSIIFYLAMYVVLLIAGVLLWNVAYTTGTIDNLSNFFESFGWKSFEFRGGEIFHNAWIIGLFLVAGLTGVNVVMATLYNLLTDLVGGVRVTVLEEEVVLTPPVPGEIGRAHV